MIPFNMPARTGNEDQYVLDVLKQGKMAGDGKYTKLCEKWFETKLMCDRALLTTSCTHALEMAALLIGIQSGDEVIMPSYTFVSTANAFVMRGAKIIFVDIHPDSMNINEQLIEAAITSRTKAIVPVHYAGTSSNMSDIVKIAAKYNLFVIEDAAQCIGAEQNSLPIGIQGHMSTYSFHETKNITSGGEGGMLVINDSRFIRQAEIIREKGTNRSEFFRNQVDKYTWQGVGSSYLASELQAAYLWGQLEVLDNVIKARVDLWDNYQRSFEQLSVMENIGVPKLSNKDKNNGHIFFLKCKNSKQRSRLIEYMASKEVMLVFHYVPLHSSPAGMRFGSFSGVDSYTTVESEKLVRLPMWYGMQEHLQNKVIEEVYKYFEKTK